MDDGGVIFIADSDDEDTSTTCDGKTLVPGSASESSSIRQTVCEEQTSTSVVDKEQRLKAFFGHSHSSDGSSMDQYHRKHSGKCGRRASLQKHVDDSDSGSDRSLIFPETTNPKGSSPSEADQNDVITLDTSSEDEVWDENPGTSKENTDMASDGNTKTSQMNLDSEPEFLEEEQSPNAEGGRLAWDENPGTSKENTDMAFDGNTNTGQMNMDSEPEFLEKEQSPNAEGSRLSWDENPGTSKENTDMTSDGNTKTSQMNLDSEPEFLEEDMTSDGNTKTSQMNLDSEPECLEEEQSPNAEGSRPHAFSPKQSLYFSGLKKHVTQLTRKRHESEDDFVSSGLISNNGVEETKIHSDIENCEINRKSGNHPTSSTKVTRNVDRSPTRKKPHNNAWDANYKSLGSSKLALKITRSLQETRTKSAAQKSMEALNNVWEKRSTRFDEEPIKFDSLWRMASSTYEDAITAAFSASQRISSDYVPNNSIGASHAEDEDMAGEEDDECDVTDFSPQELVTPPQVENTEQHIWSPDFWIKKKCYDEHCQMLEELHSAKCKRCKKQNGKDKHCELLVVKRDDVVGSMIQSKIFKSISFSPFCAFEVKFLNSNDEMEHAVDNGGPQHEMFTEFFQQLPDYKLCLGDVILKPMEMENKGKLLLPHPSERPIRHKSKLENFYFALGKIMLTAILLEEKLPRSFSLIMDSILGYPKVNETKEMVQLEEELEFLEFKWILTQHEAASKGLTSPKVLEVTLNPDDTTLLKDISKRNLINEFLFRRIFEPRSIELAWIKNGFENMKTPRISSKIDLASLLLLFSRRQLHDIVFRSNGISREDFFNHIKWKGFSKTKDTMVAYFNSMLLKDENFATKFVRFASGFDYIPDVDFIIIVQEMKVHDQHLPSVSACEQKV